MTRNVWDVSITAMVFGAVLALTGCVASGGTTQALTSQAESSASETATAELALSLYAAGRSTGAVAATALSDALAKLAAAQSTLDTASVSTGAERRLRAETLSDLHDAVTAVQAAQDVVAGAAGAPSPGHARAALKAVTTALRNSGPRS